MSEMERMIGAMTRDIDELRRENDRLRRENEKLKRPPLKGTSTQKLRAALKRAVHAPGHHYQCSAERGMESDCHCGWAEVRELAR